MMRIDVRRAADLPTIEVYLALIIFLIIYITGMNQKSNQSEPH